MLIFVLVGLLKKNTDCKRFLKSLRASNPNKLVFSHLNINSIRNKLEMLSDRIKLKAKYTVWKWKVPVFWFFLVRIFPHLNWIRRDTKYTPFISNTFISNARLKLAKNQADTYQHPEVELLLFENYSHPSSTLSSKNNRTYFIR